MGSILSCSLVPVSRYTLVLASYRSHSDRKFFSFDSSIAPSTVSIRVTIHNTTQYKLSSNWFCILLWATLSVVLLSVDLNFLNHGYITSCTAVQRSQWKGNVWDEELSQRFLNIRFLFLHNAFDTVWVIEVDHRSPPIGIESLQDDRSDSIHFLLSSFTIQHRKDDEKSSYSTFGFSSNDLLQKCHLALFELSRKRLDFLDFCVVSTISSEAELAKQAQATGNVVVSPVHHALHHMHKRDVGWLYISVGRV